MPRQKIRHKKRILIIEDDCDIAKLVSYALQGQGFEVGAVSDGETGLCQVREKRPDLLILDLNLPGIPGEEVCKSIREDDDLEFSKLPILMLTAKSGEVDQIVGKVIGANVYMTKPFELEKLISEAKRLVASETHSKDAEAKLI